MATKSGNVFGVLVVDAGTIVLRVNKDKVVQAVDGDAHGLSKAPAFRDEAKRKVVRTIIIKHLDPIVHLVAHDDAIELVDGDRGGLVEKTIRSSGASERKEEIALVIKHLDAVVYSV